MFSLAFRTFFAILKSISASALSLDFTTGSLDSRVTFNRSTTGTYVGSNGLIQTAAVDVPRFDYDPSTLAIRGLLVEDARTNVILQSQAFSTSPWVLQNSPTVSTSGTAPDGTSTATLLTSTSAGGSVYQGFTASASIYSTSVYAKAGTSTTLSVVLATSSYGAGINCTFDLTNGAVGTILTYGGAGNQNAYIENAGNGWYKCTVVTSCAASTTYYPQFLIPGASSTVYIWGSQTEIGDTSSSYIPTTTVALARGIDIAEVNSISSFYNSEASTLFFQGIPTATLLSPLQTCVTLHDKSYTGPLSNGAFQNRMNLARYYLGAGIGVVTAQGTNTLLDIEPIWPAFTLGKIAMSNTRNKQLSCCNGTTSGSNTAAAIPNAATTLTIGSRPVDNLFAWRGRVQKVDYYNTALNEAQLKALTGGWVESDPYWDNVSLLLQADGPANARNNNAFLDGSNNALSVSRSGNVTQGAFSPFTKTYPYNVNLGGGSIYVNSVPGNNLIVASSTANAIGTGQFTIEAWVYIISGKSTPSGNGGHTIISQGNNASNLMWQLQIDDASRVIYWGLTGGAVSVSGSPITFNAWNHIAVTRDAANSEKIFLNGAVINTRTNTSNYNNASSYQIQVGSSYDTNYPSAYGISSYGNVLNGYISNLRVVPGVAVYTSAFTPPTTPLTKTQIANAVANIGAISPTAIPTVEYLAVAGGGGGGGSLAGGGGAGGLLAGSNLAVASGTPITVTVGAGGLKGSGNGSHGSNGGNSVFGSLTSIGGGGGGAYYGYTISGNDGNTGGSGGGAGSSEVVQTHNGGAGTSGQGYAGGSTVGRGTYNSGGGGGAGGAGSPGVAAGGGYGGIGVASSITGTSTYYAGGGGGAGYADISGQVGGAGGLGGGANGGSVTNSVASDGTTNTGGGGAGAGYVTASGSGGSGGSGIVIIRQADTNPIATTTGSPTITTSGGYRIYKFTSSGTIQFSTGSGTSYTYTSPVSLLLNGVNAAVVDTTGNSVLETVGDAQISTSVRQYGTGSLKFDGTDDRLSFAPNAGVAFGTGDFTIECWLNSNNVSSANQLGVFQTSDAAGGLKTTYTSGMLVAQGYGTSTAITGALTVNINGTFYGTSSAVITTGTWYHFALTRASGALKMFVNGAIVVNAFDGTNIAGQNLIVGGYYNTSYLYNGYIDDFRITKGVARYTAAFTPPVSALPFIPRAVDAAATPVNSLNKSLRFRSSASAFLNRTLTTPTDPIKWTWSAWVKRGKLGSAGVMFQGYASLAARTAIQFNSSDQLVFNGTVATATTTAVFRDPAAWYHIVCVYDSANATAANRLLLYVNGTVQTVTGTQPTASQVEFINGAWLHYISTGYSGAFEYLDEGLAEVNFVDGQALAPTAFGGVTTYDQWMPKAYTGTYGTNGFYLPFSNTTSTSTLVADSSGNSNNWTPNNISLTAGYTYDSMTDVPTRTSVTAGNYAVLNPLACGSYITLSSANLQAAGSSTDQAVVAATFAITTPTYWECKIISKDGGGNFPRCGAVSTFPASWNGNFIASATTGGVVYRGNGDVVKNNNVAVGTFTATAANDILGFALDPTAQTCAIYLNNTLKVTVTGITAPYFPAVESYTTSGVCSINFGQQPFAYTKPANFLALNSYNTSTIPMLFPAAPTIMPPAVETLVVAGGAGGGGWGGGGGAGGLIHNASYAIASGSSYAITVGAGGIAGTTSYSSGGDGSYSRFGTMTSVGGGGAGHYQNVNGRFGGSGGGGGGSETTTQQGGYGIVGQGNAGGTTGGRSGDYYGAGGGGGAGAVGTNFAGLYGGPGGIGLAYSISGTSTYYAGGGGGNTPTAGYGVAAGGLGGGGAGSNYYSTIYGVSGTANTGGGGGGGYYGIGAGGSGIVIIRYLDSYLPASATTGSPIYTVSNGYRVYKFTGSGTITF